MSPKVHLYRAGDRADVEVWCGAAPAAIRAGCRREFTDKVTETTCHSCLSAASQFGQAASDQIPPYRSGPLRATHQIPSSTRTDGLGSYTLRLYWNPIEDGRVLWVDFELFDVISVETSPNAGQLLYPRRGWTRSGDLVANPDEAERAVHGFVKWDGCTQFDVASVHIDGFDQLKQLHAAIELAREFAAEVMPSDSPVREDYR